MRSLTLPVILGTCLAVLTPAQSSVTDVPLPVDLPSGFEGPTFAGPSAVAVATRTVIYVWRNLPQAPEHTSLKLSPWQNMAAPWRCLNDDTAIYQAVGTDLAAGTADDELVLVTGLPSSPSLVPTGVFGIPPAFVSVNRWTAVAAAKSGFKVLRYGPGGTAIEDVPVAQGLVTGEKFGLGAADADAAMALGLGSDRVPGTWDDQLVVLRGLEPQNRPRAELHDLPTIAGTRGFLVTAKGAGVLWRPLTLPAFEVVVVHLKPGGPKFLRMIVVTPASIFIPGIQPPAGVRETPEGGIDVWNRDEAGPGIGHVLLADLDVRPVAVASWYDDWNGGQWSDILGERDVAFVSGMAPGGFQYARYGPASSQFLNVSEPTGWNDLSFVRPNPTALAAFGHVYAWPSPITATLTIALDVFGTNVISTVSTVGSWVGTTAAGQSYNLPRAFALGPGRVAGFLDSSGHYSHGPPDVLRIFTVPTAGVVARANSIAASPLRMSFNPPVPATGTPFTLRLEAAATAGASADLAFAWERGPAMTIPGTCGNLLLDPYALIAFLAVPMQAGTGQARFLPLPGPPELTGIPIYVQARIELGGSAFLGDLGLLVFGETLP